MVYSSDLAEYTRSPSPAERALVERVASESIVLLKNDQNILPLRPFSDGSNRRVAIMGPNAKAYFVTGGGSAQLRTSWCQSPWEGISDLKPEGIELAYALGCHGAKFLPVLDASFSNKAGVRGFDLLHYAITEDGKQAAEPSMVEHHDLSDMWMYDFYHPDLGIHYFTELVSVFTSPIDGEYEFGLVVSGQGWLYLDDMLVIDNSDVNKQIEGTAFRGFGTTEVLGRVSVKKGKVSEQGDLKLKIRNTSSRSFTILVYLQDQPAVEVLSFVPDYEWLLSQPATVIPLYRKPLN